MSKKLNLKYAKELKMIEAFARKNFPEVKFGNAKVVFENIEENEKGVTFFDISSRQFGGLSLSYESTCTERNRKNLLYSDSSGYKSPWKITKLPVFRVVCPAIRSERLTKARIAYLKAHKTGQMRFVACGEDEAMTFAAWLEQEKEVW